jgi:hypothetical protein
MATDSGLLSVRLKLLLNTTFVVLATLLIGDAIHKSVVTGTLPITAPQVVLEFLLGATFGAVSYRFKVDPSERLSRPEPDEDGDEFDAGMSPLDEDGLENIEER